MTLFDWLPLIPGIPLAGFLLLALSGGHWRMRAVGAVGCGSVGLSFLLTVLMGIALFRTPDGVVARTAWQWIATEELSVGIGLRLDALSLLMALVITGVGFLIHLYSVEYMAKDGDRRRFFAYLNLFVCAMLVLVLADNLVLLLLGWEGVGLCSYLLIGFWYRNPENGAAARKAFVVTRIGDVALLMGMFLLFYQCGTLQIDGILAAAPEALGAGTGVATLAALLLLGGALGKSAQLPLQTWLPDAMAGPSPVSALIHAATMVTAGVYLIARHHVIFELSPVALGLVGAVGAVTLIVAGCSALAQRDLKRVLAYSTISQIGYMFLALGAGAWAAAMFHFMTHAFFKALLFLAAGAVIHALHDEQDMEKMGGLRSRLPGVFWTFLIGSASLAALPLVTSGFYSKDLILVHAWLAPQGGIWLWAAGMAGAGITALYTARMVLLTFFGEAKTKVGHAPGGLIMGPMIALAVLSTIGGFLEMPHTLGGVAVFSGFLASVLPGEGPVIGIGAELALQGGAAAVVLLGLAVGWRMWGHPETGPRIDGTPIGRFWNEGWGFDRLYDAVLVRPFVGLARLNRADVIDRFYDGLAGACQAVHRGASGTQTGMLRRYSMGVAAGAIIVLIILVFL